MHRDPTGHDPYFEQAKAIATFWLAFLPPFFWRSTGRERQKRRSEK